MPESRDRLIREYPLSNFSLRTSNGVFWANSEQERVLLSSPPTSRFNGVGREGNLFGSPFRGRSRAVMGSSPSVVMGTPQLGNRGGWNVYGSPYYGGGQGGLMRFRTGGGARVRVRNSPLPIWYPRTPLRDITAVVNASGSRSRSHPRRVDQNRIANSSSQELGVSDPGVPSFSVPLEHIISATTPYPKKAIKGSPLPVLSKILLETRDSSDSFMTPQKKLLNSIDQVEKVVMEEFQMMKRTPSARKAERKRKVHNLMSMR